MSENSYVEYKREYTSDIKKEVLAFANSSGGVIHAPFLIEIMMMVFK